jgi:phage major head subunit gpT-like protein
LGLLSFRRRIIVILSDNWGELLLPGLRTIFSKHQKPMPDFISQIYNVETSTKAQEFNQGVGELGTMDEWEASGRKISYEDFDKGFKATYTHKKYSKGIQVERELLEDDQYSEIKKKVRKLSTVVYYTTQTHAASVFNNAASAKFLGPDGKPLCATDHPVAPGSSTTFSNLGTRELTADNVELTRTDMKAWKDDKGNLIMINPDTLIVPTALRKKATIIAETKEEPEQSDYGVNVWYGNLKVIEWPFLTDSNAWFLADSTRMKLFLNWYWRRRPDFKDHVEFDTEVAKYAVLGRWSFGFDDPSFIMLNNPS